MRSNSAARTLWRALWAGRCVGVLSLNDARDAYGPDDMTDMTLIAQTLAPALI